MIAHRYSLIRRRDRYTTSTEQLRASTSSPPAKLAGAIAARMKDGGSARIEAMGAGAVNQAVKAVAIARGYVAPSGMDLVMSPSFEQSVVDGQERTVITLTVSAAPTIDS